MVSCPLKGVPMDQPDVTAYTAQILDPDDDRSVLDRLRSIPPSTSSTTATNNWQICAAFDPHPILSSSPNQAAGPTTRGGAQ